MAAKVFGDYPDKMAYPDLITSILCIPLLYFFLRKYFDTKISLALSAIFSLSEFAIRWSRFAWNPNSTPFWTLIALYSLHEIVIEKNNRKLLWSLLAGLAIGIGVQLHTMLLLFFPITTSIIFGYLLIKNNKNWKYFFVIFATAFLLNVPQFMHEYLTNGENIRAFFSGIETKQENQQSLLANFIHGNSSMAQIVPDILVGYEISDNFKVNFDGKHLNDVIDLILGALFTLGGVILAARYYKAEKNADRKAFLAILAVYMAIAYIIFIKLSFTVSVRMYLVLFFAPFILLGFWLQFLREKFTSHWNQILIIIGVVLVSLNLFFVKKYFEDFTSYFNGTGTVNIATLGGTEKFAKFITDSSVGETSAYVAGDKHFLFVSYRSIAYVASKSKINLNMIGMKDAVKLNLEKFYYIGRENKLNGLKNDLNYKIAQKKTNGKFTIVLLEKK